MFGIDTWNVYFERLQRGEDQWYFVMQTDDPIRIDQVVSLAEERLPLKDRRQDSTLPGGPPSTGAGGPQLRLRSRTDP
jgi:hypothetical protein